MKGKKQIVPMLVLVLLLVSSACFVYANPSAITFEIVPGVNIRFKNEINMGRLSSYAETHSSDLTTQTYVNATFYYVDYENEHFGTVNKSQGHDGGSQVNVGPNTFPNITVTHNGITTSTNNLTSYAP